jgi:hypothetical protein
MAVVVEDVETTRVEAIIAAHACRWEGFDEGGDEGRCACGVIVTTEEQWGAHTDEAVTAELWTPTAQVMSTASDLAALPMRSAILVRPGRENTVFRRLVLEDPKLQAWCNTVGQFRPLPGLIPALVLERDPTKVCLLRTKKVLVQLN